MSDRFNPLHYLDSRLINESPLSKTVWGLAPHFAKRKSEFDSFLFIITNEKGLIHSDLDIRTNKKDKHLEYTIGDTDKKIAF